MAGSGGEDVKFCVNCKRDIAAVNFVMHEVHCRRNIVLCSVCDEPVARSEMDNHMTEEHTHCPQCNAQVRPTALEAHIENEHGSRKCPDCNEEVINKDFPKHKNDECLQRKVPCKICELELPVVEIPDHESWCGSRTELCTMCERYIKLIDLDVHISTNCQYPEVKKKEKTPLSSDQDLAQRLKAYEFRREELNRALGLDGQWNRVPATLRNDQEFMDRFHPEQADAVEAGNQMLRIEQMADAMMTGEGFVDRYTRRRDMFSEGDGDNEPEDVLTRARRRRRMNEEAAAGNEGAANGSSAHQDPAVKPRSLDEIRKERIARQPGDDGERRSRFLWVGGGRRSEEAEESPQPSHRLSRIGVALPGFDQMKKEKSPKKRPKEKTPTRQKNAASEDSIQIPCEFCMNPFPIERLMDHQEHCGPNANSTGPVARNDVVPSDLLGNLVHRSGQGQVQGAPQEDALGLLLPSSMMNTDPPSGGNEDALPCEFCEELFPFDVLIQHQSNCDKNPAASRPTSGMPTASTRESALAKLNEKSPQIFTSSQPSTASVPPPIYSSARVASAARPDVSSSRDPVSNGAPVPARARDATGAGQSRADRYQVASTAPYSSARVASSARRESRHKKSEEKEKESVASTLEDSKDLLANAKATRERLLFTSGKILGKQSNIDLSGDTNARYHAKFASIPGPNAARDPESANVGVAPQGGGAAAGDLLPSAAYADEATDRYLSHRERMMTATRERMGDAAASSRSQDWASQILDNLLDDDGSQSRDIRGSSHDRVSPGSGSGANGSRANGARPRPSPNNPSKSATGYNSPVSKYSSKR